MTSIINRSPNSKKFQNWVKTDVLPAIQRTGRYEFEDHEPLKCINEDGLPYFSRKNILHDPTVVLHEDENIDYLHDKKVMYHFATSITNMNDDRVIHKFGYSADILARIASLEREYACEFKLMAVKEVFCEGDEKLFHRLVKRKFPKLHYLIQVDTKRKVELYYADERLTAAFEKFKPTPKKVITDNEIEMTRLKLQILQTRLELKKTELALRQMPKQEDVNTIYAHYMDAADEYSDDDMAECMRVEASLL
jgi:hypothetical protein